MPESQKDTASNGAMQCVVVTPEATVLDEPADFVALQLYDGEIGIGPKHSPMPITPWADTIRSFEEICDGKWDHLPEDAFMYVGAIEQAEEQWKKSQK